MSYLKKPDDYDLGVLTGDSEEPAQDRWDALKELELRVVKALLKKSAEGMVPAPDPVF